MGQHEVSATSTSTASTTQQRAAVGQLMDDRARGIFTLGAILAILLSILDQYLVVTAAVPILRHLDPHGGTSALPWLLTSYLLASTAATPLLGSLCDSFGTKRVYLFSIWMFLVGSALCGASQSVGQLIGFRVVQGIGGGGLVSVTLVALGTVFPPEKRSGAGLGGGVIGFGLVLGPLAGGVLTQYASWRWVFYLNLPLGLLVALMIGSSLQLPEPTGKRRVDVLGATLIASGTCALLLGAEWAGTKYAWTSWQIVGLGGAALVLLSLFVLAQVVGWSNMLPPALFRSRVLRLGLPLQFLGGFSLLVAPAYLGVYLQVVAHQGPTKAGLTTAFMAVGLFGAANVGGRRISAIGRFKTVLVIDTLIGIAALLLLTRLTSHPALWLLWLSLTMLGVALGGVLQVVMLAIQADTPLERIGAVTVNSRFVALLGQSCGGALLGALVNRHIADVHSGSLSGDRVDLNALPHLPALLRDPLIDGYVSGLHVAFVVAAVALVLGLLCVLRMPNQSLLDDANGAVDDAANDSVAGDAGEAGDAAATDADAVLDYSARHRAAPVVLTKADELDEAA